MQNELVSFLQSSQDPSEIANKVKGGILMVSSLIILTAAAAFHVTLQSSDVASLAAELGTMAGAIWTVYGCGLHLITWWGTIKK